MLVCFDAVVQDSHNAHDSCSIQKVREQGDEEGERGAYGRGREIVWRESADRVRWRHTETQTERGWSEEGMVMKAILETESGSLPHISILP